MKQFILISAAAIAVLASPMAAAQTPAAPAAAKDPLMVPKTPSKEEVEKARAQRRATGKELGKQDAGRLEDDPMPKATKTVSKKEREDARSARRAEGKELGKQDWGRLEDQPQGVKK